MRTIRTAILISGRGSNMVSLLNAAKEKDFPAEFRLVVSNIPTAPGLTFAQDDGVAVAVVDHTKYSSREQFEKKLNDVLQVYHIEFICLAGFMRILSPWFIKQWEDKIVNIHPSLLPEYKGLHTHERALADNAKVHGCTVHYVSAELDAGPIIGQSTVDVYENDTPDTLAARVLEQEHKLYPECVKRILTDSK